MVNYFFTADLHLGHANIIKHSNRPFRDVDEMDEILIENWNKRITSPNDCVIVLGDFTFYSKTLINDPRKAFGRLRGKKYLILGNHDKTPTIRMGWEWVKETHWLTGLNQTGIWLSHYPHRSWKNSFHGAWHLYGHVHGHLEPWGLSFDVGVDANNYELIHIDEVTQRIKLLEEQLVNERHRICMP
jgi:calcineurin-like phosphoesterase family protein